MIPRHRYFGRHCKWRRRFAHHGDDPVVRVLAVLVLILVNRFGRFGGQQLLGRLSITGIAGGDLGGGDDLAVRVRREMAF